MKISTSSHGRISGAAVIIDMRRSRCSFDQIVSVWTRREERELVSERFSRKGRSTHRVRELLSESLLVFLDEAERRATLRSSSGGEESSGWSRKASGSRFDSLVAFQDGSCTRRRVRSVARKLIFVKER